MRPSKDSLLNVVLVIVAACALISTSIAAFRAIVPPEPVAPPAAITIDDWQSFRNGGHRFGPQNAPVTIVEFSDFECPYCRTAAATLQEVVQKYQGKVALIYRHYPLERVHRFARPAAIAAECAGRQGLFLAYHDLLFAQDSLTNVDWTTLASTAGVPDTLAFTKCLAEPETEAAVDRDVADAARLKATFTPTILINQYRLTSGAQPVVLDSIIKVALRSATVHN